MKFKYILATGLLALLPLGARAQETLPQPSSDDLWDVSQGTVVTSHSALLNSDHVASDIFGSTLGGNYITEYGNTIFVDEQPVDTVHTVEWQTAQPISLEYFRIFAYHDRRRPLNPLYPCDYGDARVRGFATMRLLAKNQNGEYEQVYEHNPIPEFSTSYRILNPEYQGIAPGDSPYNALPFLYEATLDEPVYAQDFKAEFVQYGDPDDPDPRLCINHRGKTGPRVVELDGFGSLEPPRDPIVIVPGMLASLSPLTTLLDIPSNFWAFNIFARGAYNSLSQQLESAGYYENENVFFAHYDWKNPVDESATNYLKPTIDFVKTQTGATKVDVVAHSMGGLVARSYIQSDTYENDIDQLITLGTPHKGAADAYVAWEGGDFPETWSAGIKFYIRSIVRALNTKETPDLSPPIAFRHFFPSLKDLIPITPFIVQNGSNIPPENLTEQNNVLQQLQAGVNELENRGVDVTTIVGSDIATLATITLNNTRTPEDEALDRWRDGHPAEEPISPNSSAGDQRVLLSSAQLGDSIISIPNAQHDKLPESAQEDILTVLGIAQPTPFHYESPDIERLLGITVLSPIDPTITCGENTLSKNQNTFPLAQYLVDPEHPDGPKILTIANPPEATCAITLVGTDTGNYTVITTYTDEDETTSSTFTGNTTVGQVETIATTITEDSSSIIDDTDYKELLENVIKLTKQGYRDGLITWQQRGSILTPAVQAQYHLSQYEYWQEKDYEFFAKIALQQYYSAINILDYNVRHLNPYGNTDTKALKKILVQSMRKIIKYSPPVW